MLDIGNYLAHLKWASTFRQNRKTDASTVYHQKLRAAALARFQWDPEELNLREAICLFRLTTNTIRRLSSDWRERTAQAMRLVVERLG